jgi:uncharacterized lipoprotein YbaY/uncharacterized lipoprotein NlpE involved in copper resistance
MNHIVLILLFAAAFVYGNTITGEALIREKIALPPDTVFTATLQDVSRADASAIMLGKTIINSPKSPIKFSIDFDESKIDPRYTYNVRATIHDAHKKLLYTTDTSYRVLTRGSSEHVTMILKKVPSIEPELPASFTGTLPCADCEGISYHLNLLPHNVFYLSSEYLGKKEGQNRFDDIGKYSSKNKVITLQGGREAPIFFEMSSRNMLHKLDMNGKAIDSKLNYTLKRDTVFQAVQPRLFMSGMYSYMADADIFKDCITGQIYSVASKEDSIHLQRAYLDTQRTINAPVMALIEGEIQQRPNMEGNLSTLIVHKFLRLEPAQQCSP